ncbi:MAG: hypothetical protein AAFP86_18100, partial [Planctomycetota bacterium]
MARRIGLRPGLPTTFKGPRGTTKNMTSHLRSTGSLLVTLSLLAACGSDDAQRGDPTPTAASGTVALRSIALETQGTWPAETEATALFIDVPEDLAGWRFDGLKDAQTQPSEVGGYELVLPPSRSWTRIDVPVDVAPGQYQRMRLYMKSPGFIRAGAQLARRTNRPVITPFAEAMGDGGPLVIEVDLAEHRRVSKAQEELTVVFPIIGRGATLQKIELISEPLALTLPAPDSAPEHVRIGSESRPAYGLPPGVTLAASVPRMGGPGNVEVAI